MAGSELRSLLERLLETVKSDEAREELEELKNRRFTLTDLMDAMEGATDEEIERWERDFFSTGELEDFPAPTPTGDNPPSPDPPGSGESPDGDEPPIPPPTETQTRPGRKRGNVYDWDVDEQGKVIQLGIGRVYNGDDEPDEVEIPTQEDDE